MAGKASHSIGFLALMTLVLGAGCRSLPHSAPPNHSGAERMHDPKLLSQHVIEVNGEGFLLDQRSGKGRAVITDPEESERYLLETVLDGFQRSGKKKILLFVHGGLNDRRMGMAHFWADYENILKGEYCPVFVVWPSGWGSTYLEHLVWVRQGIRAETPSEKTFSFLTSPFTLLADLGRAFTRLPLVVANNSKSDIETVTPIRNRQGGAAVQQYQELAREGYPVTMGDDYSLTFHPRLAGGDNL